MRRDDGFTMVELLVTMLILSLVIGGIGALFVSGTKASTDLTHRFDAQNEIGVAMDKLKRELHSACQQNNLSTTAVVGPVGSITIQEPSAAGCEDASGADISTSVTWCVRQVGTATRYQLVRVAGTSCTGSTWYVDYITNPTPFTYYPFDITASSAPSSCNCRVLARLHIDLTVDADTAAPGGSYRLQDDIAFRNSRS
jgi:prepilin-type N-terminal cleavage/methylation domain-containing protein